MKIRLAKHTRALAAALAFCVLSAVPAYAQEDDTVEVPGVPVTLSLPAGSLILTRETPVDDAIFETLNVDGAAILENMNKNDLYLDAVLFKPPHYIILDLLLNTPVFTGFHKVHTEQMQAGTTSSASSGEKCVRQSQRPVVFG